MGPRTDPPVHTPPSRPGTETPVPPAADRQDPANHPDQVAPLEDLGGGGVGAGGDRALVATGLTCKM